MVDRLTRRAVDEGVTNLVAIVGDATQLHVDEATRSCIPGYHARERSLIARQHSTSVSVRLKLAESCQLQRSLVIPTISLERPCGGWLATAGFRWPSIQGRWWFYTANFVKPEESVK